MARQTIDTNKLTEAFAGLRKAGFIARQRFSCCSGCAGAEIAQDVAKMPEKSRQSIQGSVFYTRQGMSDREDSCWINYGPVEVYGVGTFGRPATEVGQAIVKQLTEVGLSYEWDGSGETSIRVVATPGMG